MLKKNKFFWFLFVAGLFPAISPQAKSHICQEMVTNYQTRVKALKKELGTYKDKAPQESMKLIGDLIVEVEGNIARVNKSSDQGMDELACKSLYSKITTQLQQVSSKLSRLADMDVIPFKVNDPKELKEAPGATLNPVAAKP